MEGITCMEWSQTISSADSFIRVSYNVYKERRAQRVWKKTASFSRNILIHSPPPISPGIRVHEVKRIFRIFKESNDLIHLNNSYSSKISLIGITQTVFSLIFSFSFLCFVLQKRTEEMHPIPESILAAAERQLQHRSRRAVMPKVKFIAPVIERDGDYWNNNAQDILRRQLQKNTLNKNVAKNIIMFLGDGMSLPTLTATRIYIGGEEKDLSFEKFPFSGLSKVRSWYTLRRK